MLWFIAASVLASIGIVFALAGVMKADSKTGTCLSVRFIAASYVTLGLGLAMELLNG